MRKVLFLITFSLILDQANADANWVKYINCPDLKVDIDKQQNAFEIRTINTLSKNETIKGCIDKNKSDCFYLIPGSVEVLNAPNNFSSKAIKIEFVNFYSKECSYKVNGI